MSTVLVFDCDVLAFRVAAVIEKREVEVIHKASGRVKKFDNRTAFKDYLKSIDFEYVKEDYEFKDIQTPQDPALAYTILKSQIKGIQEATWADDSIFLISGQDNFRESLPLPTRYKSNRDNAIKPVQLETVRRYLKNAFSAQEIHGCETDDATIWTSYRIMEQGDTPIIVTNDKDANAYTGICLYNYTEDNPSIVTIPDLGFLSYDEEAKKVRGMGFLWYCFQLVNGDTVDCFKPSELANVKYGQMKAYALLKDCTSHKEALEAVIHQYKLWYPNDFRYASWDGQIIESNWQHMLNLYHSCCRMKSTPDDPLIAYDFFKKYGVNLDDYNERNPIVLPQETSSD